MNYPKTKNSQKKQSVIAICLIAAILISSVFALLTAKDSKANVFEIGKIDIELWENFDTDHNDNIEDDEIFDSSETEPVMEKRVLPGWEIIKQPYVKNTGNTDAWVYVTVGVPAEPKENIYADENGAVNLEDRYAINIKAYAIQDGYKGKTTSEDIWQAYFDEQSVFGNATDEERLRLFEVLGVNAEDWQLLNGIYKSEDGYDYFVYALKNPLAENTTSSHVFEKVKLRIDIGDEQMGPTDEYFYRVDGPTAYVRATPKDGYLPLTCLSPNITAAGGDVTTITKTIVEEPIYLTVNDPIINQYGDRERTYAEFFQNMVNMQTIENIDYIHTDEAESLMSMFENCRSLSALDLSHFDTSDVTLFNMMFGMDYPYWDKSAEYKDKKSSLQYVDVSNFDMSNAIDCTNMFYDCVSLQSLDVSKWETASIKGYANMFAYCESLNSLDVSNWNTDNMSEAGFMFMGCKNLQSLDLSGWNVSNIDEGTIQYYKSMGLPAPSDTSLKGLRQMFQDCYNLTTIGDVSNWETGNVRTMEGMFVDCHKINGLDVSKWDTSKVINMRIMFADCYVLDSLDVSKWNTSRVTKMDNMFCRCYAIDALNVTNNGNIWNTSKVTTMEGMFAGLGKDSQSDEVNITGLGSWNVSNVRTMKSMFSSGENHTGKGKLTNATFANINNWGNNTSKVTDMTCMFYGQGANLTQLDISDWNVSNCTSFNHMFCDCSKLKALDLSSWNTQNVKTIYDMFDDCYSLTTVGDISHWNTSNLIDMGGFLNGCTSFVGDNGKLDLSGWETPNMIACGEAFRAIKCHTIDIRKMSIANVSNDLWTGTGTGIYYETGNYSAESQSLSNYRNMIAMFQNCSNLQCVYVNQAWCDNIGSKTTTLMWSGCPINEATNISAE